MDHVWTLTGHHVVVKICQVRPLGQRTGHVERSLAGERLVDTGQDRVSDCPGGDLRGRSGGVMIVVMTAQHPGVEFGPLGMPLRSGSSRVERMTGGAETDQRLAGGQVGLQRIEVLTGQGAAADGDDDEVTFPHPSENQRFARVLLRFRDARER